MRNLASVQRVTKIQNIENAYSIVCATILGWQVVCRKDEVKEGDTVIFCEIDSLIPDIPLFEEIKKITNGTMRIRTVRMRGQVSQGICFPINIIENFGLNPNDLVVGQDVTSEMGIIKHEDEIPADLIGKMKSYMPSQIPKSSIYRVQTMQDVLDKYKDTMCFCSEKIDGESITFYLKDGEFGVCSKEVDFFESADSLHWKIAKQYNVEEKLRLYSNHKGANLGYNYSMQGEIIGEGIKKNKYKIKGQKVLLYNMFNIDKHRYLNYEEFVMATNVLDLEIVPVINDRLVLSNDINELVALSNGRSMLYDTKREGIINNQQKHRNK
ncbi:MAG TPA: RNA ligase family protein [Bacteroidia bacterium]|jgi:RNA ligase (TIGR02306 family)|nr:RNA ligase family protein [Bacteroidia bacterium]